VRLITAVAFAALLLLPAVSPAGAGSTRIVSAPQDVSDLSAAQKRKKAGKKAPKKEEYMRAAPSGPPPGAKQ
jgi:hypothetical protein